MSPSRQVLARREETATSDITGLRSNHSPSDGTADGAGARLTVFARSPPVLWTFALLLDIAILPALSATWVRNWRIIPLEIAGVVGSVIMRWYLRRAGDDRRAQEHHRLRDDADERRPDRRRECVGNARASAEAPEIGRLSWIALLILIFAMIAPGAPRRMFAMSLVAASIDPLAYLDRCGCAGGDAPALVRLFILCWPSYACAFVASCRRRCCSASAGGCARRRSSAATTWSRCSGTAAWARCGAPSIGCSRATRRSSWCAPKCSARATTQEAQLTLRAVRARGAGHRRAQLAAHDPGVRLRHHGGRHVLLRDGAARRPRPRVAGARVRPAAGRARRSTCCARSVTRWPTRTRAAWSTATSSRPTSTSAAWASSTTSSRCSTSAW